MHTDTPKTLAQQATMDGRGFFYLLLLIILAVIGGMIIFAVKRRIFTEPLNHHQSADTLLESLEQLRSAGKISEEEYRMTRQSIINKRARAKDAKDDADDLDHTPTTPPTKSP